MNATIQDHIESRRLEARPADDAEVLGFWEKALIAYKDAGNANSSLDNRLIRAYDSARIAALDGSERRVLHARRDSHHHVTFGAEHRHRSRVAMGTGGDERASQSTTRGGVRS
jgi:hypothetical protein